MKAFTDLKQFDPTGLTQVSQKKATEGFDRAKGIDSDQILRRSFEKQATTILHKRNAAVALLERLPEPGEVFTVLMSGTYDGWDYVEAILELAAPAKIENLFVATLGFGSANGGRLLASIEAGDIGHVWFLASAYMRDTKHGNLYRQLHEMLTTRGHRCNATRNHAKLIAMQMTDGRTYCVDGSLNLCSCKNTEQAHVWNDRQLFNFYSEYITGQCEGGHVK